jgi:hypothetical protein
VIERALEIRTLIPSRCSRPPEKVTASGAG